ncbi:MAG: antitoxin [Candidatus Dormibacteria bacterium]
MRTTLTLDADVEAIIKRSMRDRGISFKAAVNDAIRRGSGNGPRPHFTQRTFAMGFRPDIGYDRAMALAGALEDEEIIRKLAAGR